MTEIKEQMIKDVGFAPEGPIVFDGRRHYFDPDGKCHYTAYSNHPKRDCVLYGTFRKGKKDILYKYVIGKDSISKVYDSNGNPVVEVIDAQEIVGKPPVKRTPSMLKVQFETFIDCPPSFPYLVRKQISPFGVKYNPYVGYMAIPMYGSSWEFRGFSRIYSDGNKRHAGGSKKQGSFYEINGNKPEFPTFVCEGFATSCSVALASDSRTIVCFDCGNLADGIRSHAEATGTAFSSYIVVGDNDNDGAGEEGAQKARNELGVKAFIVPRNGVESITDANDFHVAFGLSALRDLLVDVCGRL